MSTDYSDDLVDFGYVKSCLTITACTILSLGLLVSWITSEATPAEHPNAAAQRALSDKPHVVDAAFSVCKALGRRHVLIGCDVDAKALAIDIVRHVPPLEAAGFCREATDTAAKTTALFAGERWTLRISSPQFIGTGTRLRARCKLH